MACPGLGNDPQARSRGPRVTSENAALHGLLRVSPPPRSLQSKRDASELFGLALRFLPVALVALHATGDVGGAPCSRFITTQQHRLTTPGAAQAQRRRDSRSPVGCHRGGSAKQAGGRSRHAACEAAGGAPTQVARLGSCGYAAVLGSSCQRLCAPNALVRLAAARAVWVDGTRADRRDLDARLPVVRRRSCVSRAFHCTPRGQACVAASAHRAGVSMRCHLRDAARGCAPRAVGGVGAGTRLLGDDGDTDAAICAHVGSSRCLRPRVGPVAVGRPDGEPPSAATSPQSAAAATPSAHSLKWRCCYRAHPRPRCWLCRAAFSPTTTTGGSSRRVRWSRGEPRLHLAPHSVC